MSSSEQPRNDGHRHRGNHGRNQLNEERFGKLKFNMPKFDGGSDLEAYLTWELKEHKIFHVHNYSEQKKMAMAALEFDGYALIWWEQMLNDREKLVKVKSAHGLNEERNESKVCPQTLPS